MLISAQIRKVCEWDVEKKAIKFGDHDCEKDRNHEVLLPLPFTHTHSLLSLFTPTLSLCAQWDFDRGKCVDAKFKITAFRKCTEIDKEFKVFFKVRIPSPYIIS